MEYGRVARRPPPDAFTHLLTEPLLGGPPVPTIEASSLGQDPIHRRRADRHHVAIQHHEGQPSVAFEGEALVEVQNGLLLPLFEPVIPGDHGVVFIGLAVALAPGEELAARQFEPTQEPLGGQLGLLAPGAHEIHHGIAHVMGNPAAVQGSPSSFFSWTYSAEISAMTESLRASLASRNSTL